MSQSRRTFVGAGVTLAAASALGALSVGALGQSQSQNPNPTIPNPFPPDSMGGPPPRRIGPAERMKANQEQIKKSTVRLAELIVELQKDLEANDTTNVLSLGVIRKTEEIEKLARQIKSLVRG